MAVEIVDELTLQYLNDAGETMPSALMRAWKAYLESLEQQRIKQQPMNMTAVTDVCSTFFFKLQEQVYTQEHWSKAYLSLLLDTKQENYFQQYGEKALKLRAKTNVFYQESEEDFDSFINCVCVSVINNFREIFSTESGDSVNLGESIPF